ncbi:FAD-dependent oxidoreductase [Acrocarpospora catenulata]|uniref:FAD-dependent oxidoreductase n=1 Tax=Acrocarpospora catenulata TaxID=2836182 RepID=UPI001BDAA1F1|nr:NAD(P)/FAD-dependent oxidoreductase [Acrocarpospora catenulata]
MTHRYDAIVVGARCAGAATAMLLARAGLRVLLADRAAPGTDTLSTHALMRGGVLQLTRWGLLDGVVAAGTPAITRTSFDYGCQATTVTIRASAGVSALYAPRRTVLDPLLAEAAEQAGAEVAFGFAVTGVHRDGQGRVCGVTGRDGLGRSRHAYAPLVIGADGLSSTVAEAVGATVTGRGRHASAFWLTYVTGPSNQGYRWFYRPGASFGLIPTNDGATCVFGGLPAAGFRAPARGARWQALLDMFTGAGLDETADELRSAAPVSPVRGWPGVPNTRRAACGPGWALVGDAGYYKDPIGTHGITQALRDAQILADAVVAGYGGAGPVADALARYERLRDGLSAGLFAATDAVAAHDWDLDTLQELLRRLSSEMSREVDFLSEVGRITTNSK